MSAPSARADRRWTGQCQLVFLDTLAQTRSVTRSAAAAGMSRESAYRLRRRPAGALLAAAWDRLMRGHTQSDRIRHPAEGNGHPGNRAKLSRLSMS